MSALKTYGEMLRAARVSGAGVRLTLDDVAKHLELSPGYVGEVERGKRAPLDVERTMRWARYVGLSSIDALAARARYHEQSTLKLGLRPDQDEAAIMLSQRWPHYSRDQIRRIVEAAS